MQTTLPPSVTSEIQHQPQHKPNKDEGVRIQRWIRIIDTLTDGLDPDKLLRIKLDSKERQAELKSFVVSTKKGDTINRQAILHAALEEIAQLGKC